MDKTMSVIRGRSVPKARCVKIGAMVALSLAVVGCSSVNAPKQDQGLVAGAVAGGVLGSAVGGRGRGGVIGGVLGAVAGGIVGSEVGRGMDERDRERAMQAEYRAFNSPKPYERYAWENPNTGRRGEVVPGPMYRRGYEDCRDYTHIVYIDGRPREVRGVACRNPDGTWRNVG